MKRHKCAVVDAQFFVCNNNNVVREIAVLSHVGDSCAEVSTGIKEEHLYAKDLKTNRFIKEHITGLTYEPRKLFFDAPCLTQQDISHVLQYWHQQTKKDGKYLFAIKKNQLEDILKGLEIPCVSVICDEEYSDWFCAYHTELPPTRFRKQTHKCALRKCYEIQKNNNDGAAKFERCFSYDEVPCKRKSK